MTQRGSQKIKVLFFAWGDSIHARRRIKIFTEDSAFEVGVISTFAYEFENVKNYYLSNAKTKVAPRNETRFQLQRLFKMALALPLFLLLRLFDKAISLSECSYYLTDAMLVRRYAREFKPDCLFLQTLMYPCYLAFLLPRHIPIIITFWNGDVTWWAKWNGMERAFKKRIVLHGVRNASAITVNSGTALHACLGYGATPDKVKLIRYPGIDLDMFMPQSHKLDSRKRLRLQQEKIVLCPRGLGGYLNSDIIIEAAAKVIKTFPDTLFIFLSGVGSDEVWKEHRECAQRLGIAANIRRDGQVPWIDMPMYYHAADVMVSVSSNDSLPNCMLEAMACGVPLIMGDLPQIQELVRDGQNGYLVQPRDSTLLAESILKVLNDSENAIEGFIQYNVEKVRSEVDSRKVADAVKNLVHHTAQKQLPSLT